MLKNLQANLELESGWSGSISACSDVCDVTRTSAELNIGAAQDQYDISLVNGFNLPMKVNDLIT